MDTVTRGFVAIWQAQRGKSTLFNLLLEPPSPHRKPQTPAQIKALTDQGTSSFS